MFTFGTLTLDRKYSERDIKRIVPLQKYGLDAGFYGGRVMCIGETGTDILLFLETNDGLKAIDTGAVSLKNIDIKFIRELAKKRKISFNLLTSKDRLIKLLGGDGSGEENADAEKRHDDDSQGHGGHDVRETVQRQEKGEKEKQEKVKSSKPRAKALRGRKPDKKPTERRKRLSSVDNEKQSGGNK